MKRIATAIVMAASVSILAGCVVAVGDTRTDDESDWREMERENRSIIARLEPGMGIADVRSRLGTPEFSESLEFSDGSYRVLFYRTQRVEADGMTTRDETTPLIFRDGELLEWGEAAWADLSGRPVSEGS
jgi:outer membrane protein assembly factor BamE (lipoprotein component of BamABCDE complex)